MAVTLDIFFDPICPWCLIGKTRLDRAETAFGRPAFERRWRVYQLDPAMPPEGADRAAFLASKFGGTEEAAKVYAAIEHVAEQDELGLRFDKITRRPSTVDAHRIVKFVEPLGTQDVVVETLFDLYFRQGADISDREVLVEAAALGGLEREVATKLLEGDAECEQVRHEANEARKAGITAVPTFVIAGERAASGALATEVWSGIIQELDQAGLIAG